MKLSLETQAKFACLGAGVAWGVYWIPLRALEAAGLHPLWATPVYFLVPLLCLLPLILWRWRRLHDGGLNLQITIFFSGLALALYSSAIVYTDVVRAILLFYLMPVWSAVLARIFLGEVITTIRALSLALALLGLMTIFGLGLRIPLPQNIGDWMGLGGGMAWAVTMVRLRAPNQPSAIDLTSGFLLWGLVLSALGAFFFAPADIPEITQVLPTLPWLIPVVLLVVVPGTFAALWGPKHLDSAVAGLLFMSEIIIGAISAALFAGEILGAREWIGITLIAAASILEPLFALLKRRA